MKLSYVIKGVHEIRIVIIAQLIMFLMPLSRAVSFGPDVGTDGAVPFLVDEQPTMS
jgi:hypothetical protein